MTSQTHTHGISQSQEDFPQEAADRSRWFPATVMPQPNQHPPLRTPTNTTSNQPFLPLSTILLINTVPNHSLSIGGRIRHFKKEWEGISQDPWILETVKGYHLLFSQKKTLFPPLECSRLRGSVAETNICTVAGDRRPLKETGYPPPPSASGQRFLQQDVCGPQEERSGHQLKNSLSERRVPKEAQDIICASWRSSANKSYNAAWNKWASWCGGRGICPISVPLRDILLFLSLLFQEGKEYSTVNTYCSTIASVHVMIDGVGVGKHPLVSRLTQGIFNSRPPKPRYRAVRSVSTVLAWVRSLPPLLDLPLKWLPVKLVVLLALSNADRSSDLQALDLTHRVFTEAGVEFTVPGLTKTRRAGQPPRVVAYGRFSEDSRLCPVLTLREYERKTSDFRRSEGKDPLFLSYQKPFKPVTAATIARWLKMALSQAGIDTAIFKAHSTRAASTSAAVLAGASMKDIMNSAGWTSESRLCPVSTVKLVVLLTLSNANRSSDLQALDLTHRVFTEAGVEFTVPGLTKTRRAGQPPRVVAYGRFSEDSRLCPVSTLREYERKTSDFRRSEDKDPLFLSYLSQ